jgi:hypothetical protein
MIFFGARQKNIQHQLLRRTLVRFDTLFSNKKTPEIDVNSEPETKDAICAGDKVITTQQLMP